MNEIHEEIVMTVWNHNNLCSSKLQFENNNPEFNDKVESMSAKDLTVKSKNGESYEVQLTTSDVVGNFRRNVQTWKSEVATW